MRRPPFHIPAGFEKLLQVAAVARYITPTPLIIPLFLSAEHSELCNQIWIQAQKLESATPYF